MIVDIACLYTSCECPSRRSRTQKLSNQLTTPCSFTPFTRKMVSGVFDLRTLFRKVSCRFCFLSLMAFAPLVFSSRDDSRPSHTRLTYAGFGDGRNRACDNQAAVALARSI